MASKVIEFLWTLLQLFVMTIVIITVLPFERLYLFLENWGYRRRRWGHEIHKTKVRKVLDQIQEWKKDPRGRKLCSARPAWKSISRSKTNKSGYHQVDLGALRDLVEIDTVNKVVNLNNFYKQTNKNRHL